MPRLVYYKEAHEKYESGPISEEAARILFDANFYTADCKFRILEDDREISQSMSELQLINGSESPFTCTSKKIHAMNMAPAGRLEATFQQVKEQFSNFSDEAAADFIHKNTMMMLEMEKHRVGVGKRLGENARDGEDVDLDANGTEIGSWNDRYQFFKRCVVEAFESSGRNELLITDVTEFIQQRAGKMAFVDLELDAAYSQFEKEKLGKIEDEKIKLIN